jgi:8-oxo-dGTP pyrophosphatase MutT (NUDIX family)
MIRVRMKTEHSAGGVILRKHRNVWQMLLIKDMSGNWTFPKGKLEKGESSKDAAIREIEEEINGKNFTLKSSLPSVSYTYKRKGTIEKTVDYFLFISTTPQKFILQKEEGIQAVKWVNLDTALAHIGYPDTYASLINIVQEKIKTF